MTFKVLRKDISIIIKKNTKKIKKDKKKKKTINKNYFSNQYFVEHPYFNTIFNHNECDNINIECPEILENHYHNLSLENNIREICSTTINTCSKVTFSSFTTQINESQFKVVYTFK